MHNKTEWVSKVYSGPAGTIPDQDSRVYPARAQDNPTLCMGIKTDRLIANRSKPGVDRRGRIDKNKRVGWGMAPPTGLPAPTAGYGVHHMQYIIDRHSAGDSRDQIIIGLVSEHGLTLNAATKRYADTAKEQGWTTGRESHKDAALATLGDRYTVDDWDAAAVRGATIELAADYGVAESTARDYCRAYSELLGVAHPVDDPRKAMFDWLVENAATATKADFVEFAGPNGLGRSASNVNEYWKGLELHRAILAATE